MASSAAWCPELVHSHLNFPDEADEADAIQDAETRHVVVANEPERAGDASEGPPPATLQNDTGVPPPPRGNSPPPPAPAADQATADSVMDESAPPPPPPHAMSDEEKDDESVPEVPGTTI